VMSAWCLGILNSHRRYLLSYSAPVLWNVAMIGALLWAGPRQTPRNLAVTLAWASVLGAALQFLVQMPSTLRLARHLRVHPYTTSPNVRRVAKNFGPVFVSRGVVQISSYIDQMLASLLPVGMVATFSYASTIVVLPVSLFGMAVSAAELPEMSRAVGSDEEIAIYLRSRVRSGLRHIAYFVIPSAAAFLGFGDVLAALLFQSGRFTAQSTLYAWGILAGAAVGLLATTMGRLYSSTYYALHDTKTPLRFALVRVVLTTVLGYLFALPLPRLLGIDAHWGAAGLTASAGIAGWVEFSLLRSRLNRRIGPTGVPAAFVASLWGASAIAALGGWGMRLLLADASRFVRGPMILGVFGLLYLLATMAFGIPEALGVVRKITRRD
jgi:putative peptidoglycan lipid II flippase